MNATNSTPLFTPNGDGYNITMPGLILILADIIYGDGRNDSTGQAASVPWKCWQRNSKQHG